MFSLHARYGAFSQHEGVGKQSCLEPMRVCGSYLNNLCKTGSKHLLHQMSRSVASMPPHETSADVEVTNTLSRSSFLEGSADNQSVVRQSACPLSTRFFTTALLISVFSSPSNGDPRQSHPFVFHSCRKSKEERKERCCSLQQEKEYTHTPHTHKRLSLRTRTRWRSWNAWRFRTDSRARRRAS